MEKKHKGKDKNGIQKEDMHKEQNRKLNTKQNEKQKRTQREG